MKKKGIVIATVAVVALGGGFAAVAARGGGAGAASAGAVATVDGGSVVATVSATGNLVPLQQFTLDFPNPARLVEVDVKQGDMVTKGQLLAKIDDRAAQDELARATAAADDGNARLSHDGPTSPELTADRLAVATALAELHAAQRALADTSLVAPTDALVSAVSNRTGELVGGTQRSSDAAGAQRGGDAASTAQASPAGGFVVLSDVSALPVRAAFSEADSARIKPGQTAKVTFDQMQYVRTQDSITEVPGATGAPVTPAARVLQPPRARAPAPTAEARRNDRREICRPASGSDPGVPGVCTAM